MASEFENFNNGKSAAFTEESDWCDDKNESQEDDEYPVDQYDLTATPNDFNLSTIFNFIESGAVKIPGFQRNYVWDIRRASKLIESLIIGLPVPQVFLYEEERNKFLVIDGQQRLMSIYYFMTQRFPRIEKRSELRQIFDEKGKIPDEILHSDKYFQKFNLTLPSKVSDQPNKFHRQNYGTLGEYKTTFDLRPIRNIIVKQVSPKDGDSAIFEIFNRLNSGGINLTPQEIRMSLYHSDFYTALYRINARPEWRRILGISDPDLHMKDIEVLLRGFAILVDGSKYNPSMIRFLNNFSKRAKSLSTSEITYLEFLFESFLDSCGSLSSDDFKSTTNRFSVTVFESVFAAVCGEPYSHKGKVVGRIKRSTLAELKVNQSFASAAERSTTTRANVNQRLTQARNILQLEQE